jgi:cellulose synthase/poly-beta-1,6-N-acetylglucosamine synthase-like glycosyltransferase
MLFVFGIFIFVWIIFLSFAYFAIKNLKTLDSFGRHKSSSDLPSLSIVLAVKDESSEIQDTLERILATNYRSLEVIVVNDRSQDNTKQIIEKVAQSHKNLKAITITELPPGWLGKVHALSVGVKYATGDYILFTDGDVKLNQEVLSSSVLLCEQKSLDHLTIIPHVPCPTFFLDLLVMTSKVLFTMTARPWLPIDNRPLKTIVGIGPFNLVRKSYFEKTQGFEWLKMDVADDVALSHLIAKDGGRSLYIQAADFGPIFPWYKDAIHMMHGLEKNIVGGFANYKISLVMFVSSAAIAPLLLILFGLLSLNSQLFVLATLILLINLIFSIFLKKYLGNRFMTVFLFPLGLALLGGILIRSAIICFRNGGIYWSGTFYPIEELRKGTRIKLGL